MRIARIVVGVLATVGGLTIVAVSYLALLGATLPDLGGPDRFVSATPSPDGKNKAVKLTVAGGGAISPYCYDVVFVVLQTTNDDEATRHDENKVFSASCSTFANHENAPRLDWTSNTSLQITFAFNTVLAQRVTLKPVDASGKVRVVFTTSP